MPLLIIEENVGIESLEETGLVEAAEKQGLVSLDKISKRYVKNR